MNKYAQGTSVDSVRSRIELEKMLQRFGAGQIATLTDEGRAIVQFTAHERMIRLTLPMPSIEDPDILFSPTGKDRTGAAIQTAFNQEIRRRWRSLVLLVKAKITAINDEIVEFEEEFLAHVVMADGVTLYERTKQPIAIEYESGQPNQFLLGRSTGDSND